MHLPAKKKVIGCRWVLRSIVRLKARFVAEGHAQTYGVG